MQASPHEQLSRGVSVNPTEQIQIWVSPAIRQLFADVARQDGMALADFIVVAAADRAGARVFETDRIILSEAQWADLLEILGGPTAEQEEKRMAAAYDDAIAYFESLGADPTPEDHEWAARVSGVSGLRRRNRIRNPPQRRPTQTNYIQELEKIIARMKSEGILEPDDETKAEIVRLFGKEPDSRD